MVLPLGDISYLLLMLAVSVISTMSLSSSTGRHLAGALTYTLPGCAGRTLQTPNRTSLEFSEKQISASVTVDWS
jgi:hypothetical protein